MRLMTYAWKKTEQVGVLSKDGKQVLSVKDLGFDFADMNDLIIRATEEDYEKMEEAVLQEKEKGILLSDVKVLAPIPRLRQDVICLGINYMAHAEESARYKKEAFGGERPFAVYFSKRVDRAIGTGEAIPSYAELVDSLDYEAELAVIIKKDAKKVKKEEAYDYVLGYTVLNDVSARNLQTRHKQWYFGKSLDGFCPMGPVIVTVKEMGKDPDVRILSRVNGEIRQDSKTGLMIFDIPHVIHELSQGMTLKAGTVIAMGTPAGAGMGFEPPRFLKSGDRVECEIEGIGKLYNTVK